MTSQVIVALRTGVTSAKRSGGGSGASAGPNSTVTSVMIG
jgi:hypothetical protein